jgi:hypothetical protein
MIAEQKPRTLSAGGSGNSRLAHAFSPSEKLTAGTCTTHRNSGTNDKGAPH